MPVCVIGTTDPSIYLLRVSIAVLIPNRRDLGFRVPIFLGYFGFFALFVLLSVMLIIVNRDALMVARNQ